MGKTGIEPSSDSRAMLLTISKLRKARAEPGEMVTYASHGGENLKEK